MKKVIIAIAVSGFVSLGFTLINNTPKATEVVKVKSSENIDFSNRIDEKRLASWD